MDTPDYEYIQKLFDELGKEKFTQKQIEERDIYYESSVDSEKEQSNKDDSDINLNVSFLLK
jgi:hypothetical protein